MCCWCNSEITLCVYVLFFASAFFGFLFSLRLFSFSFFLCVSFSVFCTFLCARAPACVCACFFCSCWLVVFVCSMHFLRFKPDIRCERRMSRTLLLDFLPLIFSYFCFFFFILLFLLFKREKIGIFCFGSHHFYVFSIDGWAAVVAVAVVHSYILNLLRPLVQIAERPLSSPHNWMAIAHCHLRRRVVRMHFFLSLSLQVLPPLYFILSTTLFAHSFDSFIQ